MARSETVQVLGLRQIGERFAKLATKAQRSAASGATGRAAAVIRKAAVAKVVANPSIDTGDLRASIIVKKVPRSQSKLTSEHIVTVRGRGKPYNKKGQRINRAPHAHLVEFGTVKMPAEPFLRPAFDSRKSEAIDVMRTTLEKRLIKEKV